MTLRARLLLGLLALAAVGLTVAGAVTYRQQHDFLYTRFDQQLNAATRQLQFELHRIASGSEQQLTCTTPCVAELRRPGLPTIRIATSDAPQQLPQDIDASTFTTRSPHFRGHTIIEGDGDVVAVALSLHEVDQSLHHLLAVELLTAGGVLLALGLLAWWVVKLGLKPLEEMEETAGAIAAGDLSRRVDVVDEHTEVGRLGIALNEMLHKIEEAFHEREQSEERLRRFVGDASHELRTPLTSIRGYAELFRRGAADRPEDLEKAMRRIEEEAGRMGVLVDDLLLLARLDQGRPLAREHVDLARITTDAVDDARTVAPERTFDYTPNGAVDVTGDEARLRQVLANLLQNAVRHTPTDTPVHVRVASEGDDAVIEVRDEGPGMAPEDAAHVFERFWRSDASRQRASGGTGLGLAIVAAIADAHGGRAEVVTAPGEGATFRVHVPRNGAATTADAPVLEPAPEPA